jgi:hypothetical protein
MAMAAVPTGYTEASETTKVTKRRHLRMTAEMSNFWRKYNKHNSLTW